MPEFFDADKPLIDRNEITTIIRVLDAARDPCSRESLFAIWTSR